MMSHTQLSSKRLHKQLLFIFIAILLKLYEVRVSAFLDRLCVLLLSYYEEFQKMFRLLVENRLQSKSTLTERAF